MPADLIRVWVDSNELHRAVRHAKSKLPNETGGVLVGYWASDSEAVDRGLVMPARELGTSPPRIGRIMSSTKDMSPTRTARRAANVPI